ncbi:Uncharacterised protein [Vibrio cholerae]|nr:Uncharacterised protein [Vibrio cholerae]
MSQGSAISFTSRSTGSCATALKKAASLLNSSPRRPRVAAKSKRKPSI